MASRDLHSFDAWGVNVIGFHRSDFGIAEAGRRVIQALDANGTPLLPLHDLRMGRWETGVPAFPSIKIERAAFPVNLLCMNGDHVLRLAEETGPELFQGRYTIALWFWESEVFPETWRASLVHVDEVWAPTRFVADSMSKAVDVPVTRVRIPVTRTPVSTFDWTAHGILDDAFVFLCMFDYGSSGARKNPIGAIEAFRTAFSPGSGATLVLKTSMSDYGGGLVAEVRQAAASHPDVHIIDARLPTPEKDALVAGCDCYVSLHRSEGFGLSLAEAMCHGRPVIATSYGGNLDFMTGENGYLVDCSLVPVGEGHDPYVPTARWADPDLGQASRLMRQVFENADDAGRVGRRAAGDMRRLQSPDAAGAVMEARLDAIRSMFPAPESGSGGAGRGGLRGRLGRVLRSGRSEASGQSTVELAADLRSQRELLLAASSELT